MRWHTELIKCCAECVYEQGKNLERESLDVKLLALDAGPGFGSKILSAVGPGSGLG